MIQQNRNILTFMNVLAHASSLRRKQRGIYPQGIKKTSCWAIPSPLHISNGENSSFLSTPSILPIEPFLRILRLTLKEFVGLVFGTQDDYTFPDLNNFE